jgi:uncharacterized membrane protein SpoIIM required for sporulation
MAYSVFGAVFIHNVTYIYCAVVSSVKCVACAKLLVSVVYPRSENHTQHIAVSVGKYVQFVNLKAGDIRSYHGSLTS